MSQPLAGSSDPGVSRQRLFAPARPTYDRPTHRRQQGLSILELLIAMALGLAVLAGVLQMTSLLMDSNRSTLQVTRLEQDLRTVMDIIVQDIRRAGSFPAAAADLGHPVRFVQDQPAPPMIEGEPLRAGLSGASISYAYRETDGKLTQGRFSHDAKAGTVLMHTGTAAAPESITDGSFMQVSTLQFQAEVVSVRSGDLSLVLPAVRITLVGHLKNQPDSARRLESRVTWRNPQAEP